ncbi:putative phosphodiesterase [Pseudomonas sp. 210_17 TE3656]
MCVDNEVVKVFVTNGDAIKGRFKADDSERLLWKAVELNPVTTREFLVTELAKDFERKTVVITHHCPIQEVAGDGHEGHLGAAYFNEWHDLVAQADVWIFGHTHHAVDTIVSGCRVISNPRGYPGERTGFSPDFTIEV